MTIMPDVQVFVSFIIVSNQCRIRVLNFWQTFFTLTPTTTTLFTVMSTNKEPDYNKFQVIMYWISFPNLYPSSCTMYYLPGPLLPGRWSEVPLKSSSSPPGLTTCSMPTPLPWYGLVVNSLYIDTQYINVEYWVKAEMTRQNKIKNYVDFYTVYDMHFKLHRL